jgi:hypothetical protein
MNADTRPPSDEQVAAATYIADLTASLGKLAREYQMGELGYLLDMARTEAENISRVAATRVRPSGEIPEGSESSQ